MSNGDKHHDHADRRTAVVAKFDNAWSLRSKKMIVRPS
jgi:hypothetical protein